jgi:hypothetical protein
MALLNDVKQALGIFYTEENKDAEISTIIAGAKAFLQNAGVPSSDLADDAETDLAKQMVIIYAKMAVNTDPAEYKINPMLVAMIAQARVESDTEPLPPEPTPEPEPEPEPDPEPTPDPVDPVDPVDPGDDTQPEGDGE